MFIWAQQQLYKVRARKKNMWLTWIHFFDQSNMLFRYLVFFKTVTACTRMNIEKLNMQSLR